MSGLQASLQLIVRTVEKAQLDAMVLLKETADMPAQQVSKKLLVFKRASLSFVVCADQLGSCWGVQSLSCAALLCSKKCWSCASHCVLFLQNKVKTCIKRLFHMERTLLQKTKASLVMLSLWFLRNLHHPMQFSGHTISSVRAVM